MGSHASRFADAAAWFRRLGCANRAALVVVVAVCGCFGALIVWNGLESLGLVEPLPTHTPDTAATASARADRIARRATSPPKEESSPTIPGLVAVDVYGNLEDKGFECDGRSGRAGGMLWDCKVETVSYSHTVSITGRGPTAVESVSATSLDYSGSTPDGTARDFLAFVASIPYTGASPQAAANWVRQNVGQDGASTVYGGAVFTLRASGDARILEIKATRSR